MESESEIVIRNVLIDVVEVDVDVKRRAGFTHDRLRHHRVPDAVEISAAESVTFSKH